MYDLTIHISILANENRKVKNIFYDKSSLKLKAFWKIDKILKKFLKKLLTFFCEYVIIC